MRLVPRWSRRRRRTEARRRVWSVLRCYDWGDKVVRRWHEVALTRLLSRPDKDGAYIAAKDVVAQGLTMREARDLARAIDVIQPVMES